MAGRQDDGAEEAFPRARLHANRLAVLQEQGVHTGLETHLAAARLNPLADVLDHAGQLVRADMRMGVRQDGRAGAVLAKDVQYLLHRATILAPGVQFPVRVGTGASLAEAVVRLGVHPVLAADQGDVTLTGAHVLAALDNDGPQA